MSRYFFDIHDGKSLPDAEGTELPDVRVARLQAIRLAGEIIRGLDDVRAEDWRMSVREDSGQLVLSIRFSATKHRRGRVGDPEDPHPPPAPTH